MQSSGIKTLEKFIDYCAVKNKVISKNIANIGTENYRRQDVDFKTCLLYTSDAADERSSVDLGGRRIIKKK